MDLGWGICNISRWINNNKKQFKNLKAPQSMKKYFLIIPSVIFFFIVSVFYYLLIIDRNPSELPSVLIKKKVPSFETSLLLEKNFMTF